MNPNFANCEKCRHFKPLEYKKPRDALNEWDGVCINKKFRKRFHVNSSSESCPSGELIEGLASNSIMPDKPINRGEFFE